MVLGATVLSWRTLSTSASMFKKIAAHPSAAPPTLE
jgi:hypothetical protein